MNSQNDHKDILEKLPLLISEELDRQEEEALRSHLEHCEQCRHEYEELLSLETLFEPYSFNVPDDDIWDSYLDSFYNKMERHSGIILGSIGIMIGFILTALYFLRHFIFNPDIHFWTKSGVILMVTGVIILLISTIREQVFFSKKERYREVDK